ncbi:MAG: alkaline phosphatase family protein [Hyphomicrobiales bacterium]|nr:alkaline phosphatase family protein [Hyphomicrobiales bacterium]
MAERKVLFIAADQWRGDALGCLGHPAASTPNLDALAADGVSFTNHFTSSAPCGPARTTLLTGLYPFIHRSVRNGTPLDRRHTNIALEVRRSGQDPVLLGYTDSSADPREMAPEDPRLKSFEGILPGFRLEASLNESCLSGWLSELARKGYQIPDNHFEIYTHPGSTPVCDRFQRGPARYAADDSDTAYIADKLIDYIRLRNKENWFAHVVFLRPHPPVIAPAPYHDMVDPAVVPTPVRHASQQSERDMHPYLDAWLKEQADPAYFESQVDVQSLPEEDLQAMRAVYFGLIAEVDAQIGRIIEHLKATGEYDETLIIFTSDHGEMLGDHWCWGKGGYFDSSNHIPLIIRDPHAPAQNRGRSVSAFTESVDLTPTILDWLGQAVPAECNGHSLSTWLSGHTPETWRRAVFWEFDFRNPVTKIYETALSLTPDECTLNVLRDNDYKYVHFTALPPLLFDLKNDPQELVNLAGDSTYASVALDYAQRLLSHRMLHAERTLTNAMLSPEGVIYADTPRGEPDRLYAHMES